MKELSDYVLQVEDLRKGTVQEVHGTRLKFFKDRFLGTVAIMAHVIYSETGMPVAQLMKLIESENGLQFQVRWKGLPNSEDSLETQ